MRCPTVPVTRQACRQAHAAGVQLPLRPMGILVRLWQAAPQEIRQRSDKNSPSRCVGAHTRVKEVCAALLCWSRVKHAVRHKQRKCSRRGALLPLCPMEFASGRRLHRRSGRETSGSRPLLALSMRGSTHMSHDEAKMYDQVLTRTDIVIQRHHHQRVGLRSKFYLKVVTNTLEFFSEIFRCGSTENI